MREIILIKITGQDKPAVTHTVTRVLEDFCCPVLDIGQAVIHDSLTLGLLVEIPSDADVHMLEGAVLDTMATLNMEVSFSSVSAQAYQEWVDQQGKARHIVTLLARKISAGQIQVLTGACARHGLNIDKISRLSGRIPLDSDGSPTIACVEFSARGTPPDLAHLHAEFGKLASELDVDIAFQKDSMYRRTRRLVCFDMDSTLIEKEVIDELAKAAGVGEQVAAITESAMRGELDFKESFAQRMALLAGLSESVLEDIAQALPITEGAESLIRTLKKLGYKTAILSGGFNYFGQYLQKKLGIDYVYANELDIANGKITGHVRGEVVDGQRKAELLRSLAEREGISLKQVVAVGDGANDLPMLSIAGLGIAFRAKPLVKAEAKQAISTLGLDAIVYLLGHRDREIKADHS